MASKKKTPKKKPVDLTPEHVAEVLSFATEKGPAAAAAQYGVSERSIWRWRARVKAGKWPEVADIVRGVRQAAVEHCKDLLTQVYEKSLTRLLRKMPRATYKELLDTMEKAGGLKELREALGDGDSESPTGPNSGGKAPQGADSLPSGGAGTQKALRVVG
jgi:hypothetical protein